MNKKVWIYIFLSFLLLASIALVTAVIITHKEQIKDAAASAKLYTEEEANQIAEDNYYKGLSDEARYQKLIDEYRETLTILEDENSKLENEININTEILDRLIEESSILSKVVCTFIVNDEVYAIERVDIGELVYIEDIEETEEYCFEGWSIDGENIIDLTEYEIEEDTTFIAIFRNKYNITYYIDSEVIFEETLLDGDILGLYIPDIEPDLLFVGWSLDGENVVDVEELTINENTSFYAVIEELKKVTFVVLDQVDREEYVEEGTNLADLLYTPEPYNSGWFDTFYKTFGSSSWSLKNWTQAEMTESLWSGTSNNFYLHGSYEIPSTVNNDLTVYFVAQKFAFINIYNCSGNFVYTEQRIRDNFTASNFLNDNNIINTCISYIQDIPQGYGITGWLVNNITLLTDNYILTDIVELYPRIEEVCTISYNALNGGTLPYSTVSKNSVLNVSDIINNLNSTQVISNQINSLQSTRYSFAGWSIDGINPINTSTITITSNITFKPLKNYYSFAGTYIIDTGNTYSGITNATLTLKDCNGVSEFNPSISSVFDSFTFVVNGTSYTTTNSSIFNSFSNIEMNQTSKIISINLAMDSAMRMDSNYYMNLNISGNSENGLSGTIKYGANTMMAQTARNLALELYDGKIQYNYSNLNTGSLQAPIVGILLTLDIKDPTKSTFSPSDGVFESLKFSTNDGRIVEIKGDDIPSFSSYSANIDSSTGSLLFQFGVYNLTIDNYTITFNVFGQIQNGEYIVQAANINYRIDSLQYIASSISLSEVI